MRYPRRLPGALWVLVLLAFVAVAVIAASPHLFAASVTEVYLLNESGVAADYPDDLAVDETGTVVVGVHNDRPTPRSYTVEVTFGDRTVERYGLDLGSRQRDERRVSFTPRRNGTHRLRARVYRGTGVEGAAGWSVELPVVVGSPGE